MQMKENLFVENFEGKNQLRSEFSLRLTWPCHNPDVWLQKIEKSISCPKSFFLHLHVHPSDYCGVGQCP